jgi:putative membrane protein
MAAGQFAIPAAAIASPGRVALNVLVVLAMAVATTIFAAGRWGARPALAALVVVAALTVVAEIVGVATGWPFGRYAYTGVLQPSVAGVPLLIPLAWFGLGLPAREVGARLAGSPAGRVIAGAVAMTAWDLFLDPQMVREGFWRWDADGFYRGIPASNYAGWLLVSLVVMLVFERLLPAATAPERATPLLVVYSWMAGMETVAFLFLFGDPLAGVTGGLVMGGLAAAAWTKGPRDA